MTSKIRIKLGPIEVEYEGSEEFLKKELPDFLSAISQLYRESGVNLISSVPSANQQLGQTDAGSQAIVGTTGTIAAKLNVTSGPDLAVAAAVRLMLGLGQGSFTRDQLLTEMKSASSYYKKSYRSNLSNMLSGLVKSSRFVETAKDTYALSANTKTDMESRLAS